jgi:hypothetical protein
MPEKMEYRKLEGDAEAYLYRDENWIWEDGSRFVGDRLVVFHADYCHHAVIYTDRGKQRVGLLHKQMNKNEPPPPSPVSAESATQLREATAPVSILLLGIWRQNFGH